MNALVEKGFAAALAASLATAEIDADTAAATESAPLSNSRPTAVVEAVMSHEVGALWSARIKITLSTPAQIAPFDAASHAALVQAARAALAWEDDDPEAGAKTAALDAALTAAGSGFASRGFFVESSEDRADAEYLQTELAISFGLEVVA